MNEKRNADDVVTSDSMVESVARALAPLAWAALGLGDTLAQKNRRVASIRHARAAIEAMRDPTVEMLVTATEDWLCVRAFEDRAEVIWKAMIDAALSGEGEP